MNQSETVGEADLRPSVSAMTDVAGYQLQERIGTGGFGEVWRAIGPGGLPKAVKILFGSHSGQHAETEMKSLQRMRELRHPFLLNIERIEVCDDRLIVVTELADGNLDDRFQQCVEEGRPGIPRDELISYLKDAADALDFMARKHGLQHLDIKPDNLLLQGNHVKVGDFGLAKEISRSGVSLINGFTPVFAPPEIFEGRPGSGSDQYSLAIVYQVMLTGTPPFNGRTAAQLTSQHLRSQPDLSSLPPADRPVIARALAKNIGSRHENCLQFVNQLAHRKSSSATRSTDGRQTTSYATKTQRIHSISESTTSGAREEESRPVSISPVPVENRRLYPTVFIGLGGLGGNVVIRMKDSIQSRYGSAVSAIRGILIDSDRRAIRAAATEHTGTGTLAIPLRGSQDYRTNSQMNLSWLSRRWLFNIPRSGQVESMRPLGRLAFCDHRSAIHDAIRDEIVAATAENGIAAISEATDCAFSHEGVNVVVVASANGGVGSGAVADMGFLVRRIVGDLKLHAGTVRGILIHGTGTSSGAADVQRANTVACLKELNRYAAGDLRTADNNDVSSVGSPGADDAPFHDVCLMHFGDGLNDPDFDTKTEQLAKYLVAESTTAAGYDFCAWRAERETKNPQGIVRLLGIDVLSQCASEIASEEATQFTSLLLRKWTGQETAGGVGRESQFPAELEGTTALIQSLGLTKDTLVQRVMNELRSSTSHRVANVAEVAFRHVSKEIDGKIDSANSIPEVLNGLLAASEPASGPLLNDVILDSESKSAAAAETAREQISAHLRQLLDSAGRMEGCLTAAAYVQSQLAQTVAQCQLLASEIETAFVAMCEPEGDEVRACVVAGASGINDEAIRSYCQQYCALLVYRKIYGFHIDGVQDLIQWIRGFCRKVQSVRSTLTRVSSAFSAHVEPSDKVPQPVIDAVDRHLLANQQLGLAQVVDDPGLMEALIDQIREQVVGFLMSAAAQNRDKLTNGPGTTFPAGAWPELKLVGGERRTLVMLPETVSAESWASRTRTEFGNCVAVRNVSCDELSAFCEISGIPIEQILARMTFGNPHICDIADRVHTRIDVDW